MDKQPTTIIKRAGHSEPYDEQKLYASIHAACLSVRTLVGEAEVTAQRICRDMLPWLQNKLEVTSLDIRTQAFEHFKRYNPDAAYAYLHHRVAV